ncbi:TetR/AcrR family transcriptional regulator C-terminal domain-containing protein [Streptomyces sp. NPDC048641]|uniref:TetR/AcrR family transcriptional regulator C-terminal domain-containing protein n=1 Tax=Streptomyces sp. NPDC048641 TaxID=3154825 RepID=UPI00342A0764
MRRGSPVRAGPRCDSASGPRGIRTGSTAARSRWAARVRHERPAATAAAAGLATTEANTYRFADAMIQALLDAGFPPRTAAWANWTVFYLILGITQEQQAESTEAAGLAAAFDDAEFPALRAASAYVTAGTFDERFEFALGMQVTALKAELGRTVPASCDGD